MILKSHTEFEEKPICYFKNDKNLVHFDPSTQKSPKFALWLVPFGAKYIKFDLKSYKGVIFMTLKSHAKLEEELICGLENDITNLTNFHQNT